MALRETSRRWLLRSAAALLLVATSLYVGLCLGRPLYYTDGAREIAGRDLASAGMLHWSTPEVELELPGPVAGRLAQLPDGRWCYGRLQADGTADLVVWDPRRPQVPPEPLAGLNSPANDLAPMVLPDGRLWFASDRVGGAGGYDLYTAPGLLASAAAVQPVSACNTALDETDPALPGSGDEIVFVRIDRGVDRGNDGTLWHWRVGDAVDPQPLFPLGRASRRPVWRDPAFTADAGALWFVQHRGDGALTLLRASRRGADWAPPLPIGGDWGTGALRAPWPSADGRQLALLAPVANEAGRQLLYRSTAHELYPWWPGQRWLEWLLLGVLATSALLLLLLHLGRRWSALDLVAQCLLLSLLLHALLFLWLMGVEIAGRPQSGEDQDGGMQVSVQLAAAIVAEAGGAGSDVSLDVVFRPRPRDLGAAAPAATELPSALAATDLAAPAAAWSAAAEPRAQPVQVELDDAAVAFAVRAGADAPVANPSPSPPDARTAMHDAAVGTAARTAARAAAVTVVTPGSGMVRPHAPAALLAGAPQRQVVAPAPVERDIGSVAAPSVALQDAAPALPAAATVAAGAPALRATSTGPAAPHRDDPAATARPERDAGDGVPVTRAIVVAPPSALARPVRTTAPLTVAPPRSVQGLRSPSAAAGTGPVELRDASTVAATAPPATPLATTGAVPRVPAPATLPVAPRALPVPTATRDAGASLAAPAPTVVPRPGSALGRADRTPRAAAASTPLPAAPVVRRASSPPVALADRLPAPAPPPSGRTAAPPGRFTPLLAAAEVAATGPRSAAIDRPVRPGARSDWPSPPAIQIAPPATHVPRAMQAPPAIATAARTPPMASAYSNRFGPAKVKALEQFGGSAATEQAVQSGLRYLATMQRRDGAWGDREDFDGKYGLVYVGKTGLCLLAFLGAGHSPTSQTEFSTHVQRAVDHLLALQDENGAFGPSSCYGHGIATYALAECYGLTKAPELVRPLERALTWILDHQGPRRDARNRGGWGYFSPGLQAEDSHARVSVSAWMIMALESARLSGVELPADVLPAAREYLELAFDQPNGWFRYNHKPSRLNSAWPTLPASTPAAAFCLQLLGAAPAEPMVAAAVRYTVERRPQRYRRYADDDFVLRGQGNVYFWYYGTLCCFLHGGDAWEQWNARLSTVLPRAQAADGSFAPIDVYAEEAGDSDRDRTYTTAMCVLCLEVYYRYFTPLLLGR